MEYKLLNLDFGSSPSFLEIQLNGFRIVLDNDYNLKQKKLFLGDDITTATVFTDSINVSKLTHKNNDEPEIRDLCFLLSYFTGRTILLKGDTKKFVTGNKILPAIDFSRIPDALKIAWDKRDNFKNDEQKRPFWYFLDIIDVPILEYIALFGSISLEIIQRIELSNITFNVDPNLNTLIEDIKLLIDKSEIQNSDLKNRLKSAVGKWRASSSPEGLKYLLKKYDIIRSDPKDDICRKRISMINTIRNDLVHGKNMTLPDWPPIDLRFDEAVFISTIFIPNLIKAYINIKFELIDFHQPKMNIKRLRSYIDNGIWGDLRLLN